MKTTLDLDNDLLQRAKALAAREGRSLASIIEDGLLLMLNSSPTLVPAEQPGLAIYCGRGGLIRGIDPNSNRSLEEAAAKGHRPAASRYR